MSEPVILSGRRSHTSEVDAINRPDSKVEILDEAPFLRMLCLERKRTERSRLRFVLMLLESTSLLKTNGDDKALDNVLEALSRATRETDIKGWYKARAVLGVIFVDIGAADGRSIANALLTRVTDALSSVLSIDQINEIRLSFHVFPEDSGKPNTAGPDVCLYPDIYGNNSDRPSRILKRIIDVSGSVTALILLGPLWATIAAVIRLSSPGPVLFRQRRIGKHGRTFTFLKFRSMYVANSDTIHQDFVTHFIKGMAQESHLESKPVYKLTRDPRVTPFGRFLRRTSLDEVPQFLNVLKGDMSLVGPRPPVPYEFECYDVWHKRRLLAVKPGITGLWQVAGRSRVKFDEMVRLDLTYASSWSVWMDMKILWRTPGAVLSGDGAY